jgi:enamine deaminase RidA (YjgF/YER057c/UK114 family)
MHVIANRNKGDNSMEMNTRRGFLGGVAAAAAAVAGAPKFFAQSAPALEKRHAPNPHVHGDVYYFYGTGSNDGFPDHVTVTDPFEKHVTRTMDALKKDLESNGCSMDSILQLQVFLCLPLADGVTMPKGKARFDAHQAQYEALNKVYHTYFGPGRSPARACMALEWIPGNSLIEMVGCARVINPPA